MNLNTRVAKLESQQPKIPITPILIFGETEEEAIAKWESEHGEPIPKDAFLIRLCAMRPE